MLYITIFLKKDKMDFVLYPNVIDLEDLEILARNECWEELFKYCEDYKYLWQSRYVIWRLTQ